LPQAVELRDQVAAVLLGCGRESAVVEFGERFAILLAASAISSPR
jgi:hypothetical protein